MVACGFVSEARRNRYATLPWRLEGNDGSGVRDLRSLRNRARQIGVVERVHVPLSSNSYAAPAQELDVLRYWFTNNRCYRPTVGIEFNRRGATGGCYPGINKPLCWSGAIKVRVRHMPFPLSAYSRSKRSRVGNEI